MGGAVTLNGFPKDERTFNRATAYVEQNVSTRPSHMRRALPYGSFATVRWKSIIILLNQSIDPPSFSVLQDIHAPLATVREALTFAAALRLPGHLSAAQRAGVVEETLALVELVSLADRKIGAPGAPDGLAPGERKRLTIAVELVSNA